MDVEEKTVTGMTKYIDREALVEWLKRIPLKDLSDGRGLCRVIFEDDFKRAIKKIPKGIIVDVAKVDSGVTLQEWISVKEPPKEKGTYIVCTDNGGVLLGHWYGTAWNVGGGAKKHLAHWMQIPKPPKGE